MPTPRQGETKDECRARDAARARVRRGSGLPKIEHPQRIDLTIENGTVLIGSDAHIWPGPQSTAMRAFTQFSWYEDIDTIILNGDVLDFAKISRFPPLGWEKLPTPAEEIAAAQTTLSVIGVPSGKRKLWPLGNHDWRLEMYCAKHAAELAGLKGVHLKDWFPGWEPCWRVRINGNVNITHRSPGGSPAARGAKAG